VKVSFEIMSADSPQFNCEEMGGFTKEQFSPWDHTFLQTSMPSWSY